MAKLASGIKRGWGHDLPEYPSSLDIRGAAYTDSSTAFHSVRLTELAPGGGDAIDPAGTGSLVVPAEDADAFPPPDEPQEPACYGAALDDEDGTDWPAFRSSPVWLPKYSGVTGDEHDNTTKP
ncbi:hypothetical protein CYMTET_39523 [Cymbomonas tetramitiformis]|uniref:Uncharacterized protein n=1 Tax=Cymbomonas tetramitiformis TaxID=36881 RepID=A0AAE0C9X0_9CHLO|nr:hypothetical protein CYMTET_39523 [Cymbomonas tetramitiformis]